MVQRPIVKRTGRNTRLKSTLCRGLRVCYPVIIQNLADHAEAHRGAVA